ncbi:sigma-54-dependent Fis family transcriptional regulator [Candidatus Poribacteria bacterium]|nr:sigma-54-dependent Fis family transcriptional regulator [Candidatus Poribacteria bacterium]
MSYSVLIADDDNSLRQVLSAALNKAGYNTVKARNGKETIECIQENEIDVMLLDIFLGDVDGLELIESIQEINPTVAIIIITGHGTTQTAIEAAKRRAYGYLTKPIDREELLDLVERAASAVNITKEETEGTQENEQIDAQGRMVGKSPAMQVVYQVIGRAAVSDETVLIMGESGTGKELVAELIHKNSPRSENPFIVVDCSAISPSLIESTLFGHVKGAYTDAHADRKGKFEQADSGTIFLDEVGELSIDVQMKLLRVLQEREIEPVGSNDTRSVNVRIIAATNQKLETSITDKTFRDDLYYRLNVVPISLPPLRERREDIPDLIDLFTSRFAQEYQIPKIGISTETIDKLTEHEWHGNVRELENAIKRALVMCSGQMLLPEHFAEILDKPVLDSNVNNQDLDLQMQSLLQMQVTQLLESEMDLGHLYAKITAVFEKPLFEIVLEYTDGNQSKASEILGINRNTLSARLKVYDIK